MSVHVIVHYSRQIGIALRYDILKQAKQFASDGHLLEVQQIVFDFSLQMLSNRPR